MKIPMQAIRALICGLVLSCSARAAETNGWDFTTYAYGWLTQMSGRMGVGDASAPADASFSDTLDALQYLKGALMFGMEAHHAPYAIFGDLFFVDLEAKSNTAAGGLTAEVKQFIAEAGGAYSLPLRSHVFKVDLLGGGRLERFDITIDADAAGVHADEAETWVDPFVGARAIYAVSSTVQTWVRGDVGGFGVGSDLTWNAQAGMDWRFSESWSLAAAYRILDVDYNDNGFLYNVRTDGPEVGLGYRF